MHLSCALYALFALCVLFRIMRLSGYDKMMARETSDCIGNVMNVPRLYLCDVLIMDIMKTGMRTRPITNMKQSWLYRNFR